MTDHATLYKLTAIEAVRGWLAGAVGIDAVYAAYAADAAADAAERRWQAQHLAELLGIPLGGTRMTDHATHAALHITTCPSCDTEYRLMADPGIPDAEPWATTAAERNAWSILAADPSFRAGMERARGEHERGEFAPFRHSHVYRWSEVKQAKASGRKPRCRLCAAEARNRTDDLAPARGILLGILLGLLAWAVIGAVAYAIWEATR